MTLHAITVLGHDRPGIIAETTGRLAGLGLNLEDSTMTLLRGHFAMMLVCEGPAADAEIEQALAPLTADGSLHRDGPRGARGARRGRGRDGVGADACTAATAPASSSAVVAVVAARRRQHHRPHHPPGR